MSNWSDIRKQFPVTERVAYLNTAAAGPLARSVMQAGSEYYLQMMEEGDRRWEQWLEKREAVRRDVAAFINAEPDEIGLTTNTSSGMNLIVDALEHRGEVISCDLEFPVSTLPWMHRRIPVHLVKNRNGELDLNDVAAAASDKTGLISLSQVQFSNGLRTDLEALGNNKGRHALVVNASQSAGVFAVDVKRMRIDALCTTGHKWMLSGYGSGFVYLSRELQGDSKARAIGWLSVQEPYAMKNDEIVLRYDLSARAELGCPHFAGIFALGASVNLLTTIGGSEIEARALSLNRYLTTRLHETGWKILSPLREEQFRSAETLVACDEPARITAQLAERGVIVTEKPQGIRVATDFFNNEADIDRLIAALGSVVP
ncbi:MAG TPA: aminotransferase class V-fold PLP-dependent enzyme [Pyrinomonadaceae bacterium]|nr:aminotransferase class V-fold PLP-dependent enzyme [Pyrinomonadaceae bacterium]